MNSSFMLLYHRKASVHILLSTTGLLSSTNTSYSCIFSLLFTKASLKIKISYCIRQNVIPVFQHYERAVRDLNSSFLLSKLLSFDDLSHFYYAFVKS